MPIYNFNQSGQLGSVAGALSIAGAVNPIMTPENSMLGVQDLMHPAHGLAMQYDNEIMNISGADVVVYHRTNHHGYDDVWEEDANPTYHAGVTIKGLFVPGIVEVEQTYRSETPYFQRVLITDTYRDGSGQTQRVESRGVNKVQNGKLWCVVRKPDETVIHNGSLVNKNTIIWQRDLRNPLKIEYFRETVKQDEYSIIGWGYYGDDNPEKSPKYWFRASFISSLNSGFSSRVFFTFAFNSSLIMSLATSMMRSSPPSTSSTDEKKSRPRFISSDI